MKGHSCCSMDTVVYARKQEHTKHRSLENVSTVIPKKIVVMLSLIYRCQKP